MLAKLNKRMFAFLGVLTILFSLCAMPAMATENSDWYSESLSPTTNNTQTIGSMDATTGEEYVGPTVDGKDTLYSGISDAEAVHDAYIDVMPVVSTNDILKWATTKGNEIIYFLQIIVQPFTIIIFIIAAFITLIGSIGRGGFGYLLINDHHAAVGAESVSLEHRAEIRHFGISRVRDKGYKSARLDVLYKLFSLALAYILSGRVYNESRRVLGYLARGVDIKGGVIAGYTRDIAL